MARRGSKRKPNVPPARGFFVTGTDTEVGKTVIAGALIRVLREHNWSVGVMKPIATGCARNPRGGLINDDAEFLAHCAQTQHPLDVVNPVRYARAVAPSVAVARTRRKIDYARIWRAYERVVRSSEIVVVEGVGGWRVPLDENLYVSDLAAQFGLGVLVVARTGLGTINHTLLTVEAVRGAGLTVAGIVLNGYQPEQATLAEETNPEVIATCTGLPPPAVVPLDGRTDPAKGKIGESVLYPIRVALPGWLRAIGFE